MATKELIKQINQLPEEKLAVVEKLVKELLEESMPEKKGGIILGLAEGQFKMLAGWNDPVPGFESYMPEE